MSNEYVDGEPLGPDVDVSATAPAPVVTPYEHPADPETPPEPDE